MSHSRTLIRVSILYILILVAVACGVANPKPTIVLAAPPHGSQFREGEDVAFQSTATDSTGVTRVELVIDGTVVRTDSATGPQGQQTFTLVQTWKATQGTHAVSVRAYNTSSTASDPAAITISISAGASTPAVPATTAPTSIPPTSQPASTATAPTAAATPGCTNNSAFVADVTVPDGTPLAPGQAFNKIWRMRNNGTCAWGAGYQLVFVSGEAMAATTAIAAPFTAPGAMADLLVAMTAPSTAGTHAGQWKLKGPSGTLFGAPVTVSINVIDNSQPPSNPPPSSPPATDTPQPPPNPSTSCSGSPVISSFTTNDASIYTGGSATLSWGAVTNADSVEIDQGIGGVAAPGSATVSPAATTTYMLTAHCGSNTATKQVKITVTFKPLPILPLLKLEVTGVHIDSEPIITLQNCGSKHYRYAGTITTNRFGDVTFKWQWSSSSSASLNLHFDAAGSKATPDFNFYPTAADHDGYIKLVVTSPNDINSNSLHYVCVP